MSPEFSAEPGMDGPPKIEWDLEGVIKGLESFLDGPTLKKPANEAKANKEHDSIET